jgi:short-subunit dehydrogenase
MRIPSIFLYFAYIHKSQINQNEKKKVLLIISTSSLLPTKPQKLKEVKPFYVDTEFSKAKEHTEAERSLANIKHSPKKKGKTTTRRIKRFKTRCCQFQSQAASGQWLITNRSD